MNWISVEGGTPAKYNNVLLYSEHYQEIYLGYWQGERYMAEIETESGDCFTILNKISHWMPLPELPGKDNHGH